MGQHSNEDAEGREHDHDHGLGLGLGLSSPRHPVPTRYAEVARYCTCYLRIVCTIHHTKLKVEGIGYSTVHTALNCETTYHYDGAVVTYSNLTVARSRRII